MELLLRRAFRKTLVATGVPALAALADVIARLDGVRMACWGDLAHYVEAHVECDDDRLALWRVLVETGERRALLLFLDVSRDRPAVLRRALDDADLVSPEVQCALVTMSEVEPLLASAEGRLGAAARELVARGAAAREHERAIHEAHMRALRSQRAATFSAESIQSTSTEVSEALSLGDPS